MREYFFANHRLLLADEISRHESMRYLDVFKNEMSYDYTVSLNLGDYELLDEKYDEALKFPVVCETASHDIRRSQDGWIMNVKIRVVDEYPFAKQVMFCSEDYSELTFYTYDENKDDEIYELSEKFLTPFETMVGFMFDTGIVFRGGFYIHASLVEKDGYGVLFLGPSGMGKSTQAKLWEKYLNAEIINGDSPDLYLKDGKWYGAGIPWDGKDKIFKQKSVPVKAVIVLEQASENRIEPMSPQEAVSVLLKQLMFPIWDDKAMDSITGLMFNLATGIPFYYLKNLADEEAVNITYNMINRFGE